MGVSERARNGEESNYSQDGGDHVEGWAKVEL